MVAVPRNPEEFFGSYVPARIATLADALAGKSSPGGVVVQFDDGQTWCLRLEDGALRVTTSNADDAIVRVYLDHESFEPLFVRGAERDELSQSTEQRRLKAAHALTIDAERADLIRNALGSVAVVIKEGEREHRIIATPGARSPEDVTCTIRLGMDEFVDLQMGRAQPLQLMMTGQLVIEGDAQIVMALAAALSG